MKYKNLLYFLFVFFTISVTFGQNKEILNLSLNTPKDSLGFTQIKTNSLFNSNQIISLLVLEKSSFNKFGIEFAYSPSELRQTSSFAIEGNAIAAVNGGFFNMESGGSVTYFEINDSVINRTRDPKLKWGQSQSLMNGAIVLNTQGDVSIQSANSEEFYESSKQESAVLITGPLLVLNSEEMKMTDTKFVTNRHPRTCLCISNDAVSLITIDGRNKDAEGMNLYEAQQFLLNIGCVDAINLDGGGSTTMWTKDKGIVNFPSDKTGERRVSNAMLIIKK